MLKNVKTFYYPKTIPETLDYIKANPGVVPIAGATALSLANSKRVVGLVDLQQLPLKYIKEEDEVFRIGAMTTMFEIAHDRRLPAPVRKCARRISDTLIISAVTMGGNVSIIYPWSDFPSLLIVSEAKFLVQKPDEKAELLTVEDYFEVIGKKTLASCPFLLLEVHIPKIQDNSYLFFEDFASSEVDKAQIILSSYISLDGSQKLVQDVRIAVSALTKKPQRVSEVEKILKGKELSSEQITLAVSTLRETLAIIPDFRSSVDYRKEIVGVILKRALEEI